MRTYFILVFVFWWWPLLLLLTFVPAIVAGAVCGWRMRGLDWKRRVLAGLVSGFVGLGCSIAWYAVGTPGMDFMLWLYCNLVLPVPSVTGAWMTCRLCSRSRLRRGLGRRS